MPQKFTPEYPPEFRAEAVRLVREGGRQVSVAAKDLGVSAESLRHWVAQAELDSGGRKNGLTTDERQELVRLRRRVRDLEEDKVILKKATVGSTHRRKALGQRSSWCSEAERLAWASV
jgi:transposase